MLIDTDKMRIKITEQQAREIAAIKAKFDDELALLAKWEQREQVRDNASKPDEDDRPESPSPIRGIARTNERGDLAEWIRKAVTAMTGDFTIHDIARWVGDQSGVVPKITSVGSFLKRYALSGQIKIAKAGGARRATIYHKAV